MDNENRKLRLTFKNILTDNYIKISPVIISELKKKQISDKNENIRFFQNIEEVIILGKVSSLPSYKNYLIILYITKLNGIKEGLLLANLKKFGDIVIGIWPFNSQFTLFSPEEIVEKLNKLINNSQDYDKICLVN
ncbi:MAG: hypothetical protein ACTSRI_19310 [Promethearchaeota archaeon]